MATATKARHKWTAEEKAELISRVKAAKTPQARREVLDDFVQRIGTGISPASVQAMYYVFLGQTGQKPKRRRAKASAAAPARKGRVPNGLSPVIAQLHKLERDVTKAEADLANAQKALASYRSELAKIVG